MLLPRSLAPTLLACLAGCATSPAASTPAQGPQQGAYSFSNPEPLEGNIFTDSPSFGSGTRAVPIGRVQIEAGYTYSETGDGTAHSVPNTLIRTGLTDRTELRLSTAGFVFTEGADDGFGDLVLEVRYEALSQDGLVPELALQPVLALPTGSASDSDSVDPGLLVPMAWSIDDRTSVLVNAGVFARTPDAESKTEFDAVTSALIGRTVSDTVWLFGEYFAAYSGGAADKHSLDFGATWLWSPNLQLDSAIGFGLNGEGRDVFVTVGGSFRF